MTTLENGLVIDESMDAKCFTPAAQVGAARNVQYITIHWWGKNADGSLIDNFDGVCQTFTTGERETSAHFVAQSDRVACLVNPNDVAWACGNWDGNLVSVSIECRPAGSDADYNTIASLIRYIRSVFKADLPLVPHNHWVATECPGTYDLSRLEALAGATPNTGGTMASADVSTQVDRLDMTGKPDGSKTSVELEAQWAKANKDQIIKTINAARDSIITAIQAKA